MLILTMMMAVIGQAGDGAIKPLAVLEEPNGEMLAFSPDGKMLVTRGGVWDVASRRRVCSRVEEDPGYDLVISPDGQTHAVRLGVGGVSLRDPGTGREKNAIRIRTDGPEGHYGNPTIAYAPDGKSLAVLNGNIVQMYDTSTLKLRAVSTNMGMFHEAMAYAPDGRKLALGCPGGDVRLIHTVTLRPIGTLRKPPSVQDRTRTLRTFSLAHSPDGKALAAGTSHGTLWLWNQAGGPAREVWNVHTARKRDAVDDIVCGVDPLAYAPDSKTLALAGCVDGMTYPLDASTGRQLAALKAEPVRVTALAFSPDGNLLATGGQRGHVVELWDLRRILPGP